MLKNKIIAVDFDGTLCENKWPDIGAPNKEVLNYIKSEKENGAKIVLWTCRTGELLHNAVLWCDKNHQLQFDMVNANLPEVIKEFGEETRKIFANEYIDDRANTRFKLPYKAGDYSESSSWAKREIEIACRNENPDRKDGEFDYGCACYESALKAYESLCDDGHSGFSIGLTKNILNRLIEHKPLTPIDDTDDIWTDISDVSGLRGEMVNYQCKRMGSLFKYVYSDGTVRYSDNNSCYAVNVNSPNVSYTSGLVRDVFEKLWPITMPYYPTKPTKFVCDEFLTDKKNGDFDTVGILYAFRPDGEKIEINRFFKESTKGWDEIDITEYDNRKASATKEDNSYDS